MASLDGFYNANPSEISLSDINNFLYTEYPEVNEDNICMEDFQKWLLEKNLREYKESLIHKFNNRKRDLRSEKQMRFENEMNVILNKYKKVVDSANKEGGYKLNESFWSLHNGYNYEIDCVKEKYGIGRGTNPINGVYWNGKLSQYRDELWNS